MRVWWVSFMRLLGGTTRLRHLGRASLCTACKHRGMDRNTWHNVERRYHRGRTLRGRITAIATYGCYVELEPGIEGLVQVGGDAVANRAFQVDAEIDVVIVEVNAKH